MLWPNNADRKKNQQLYFTKRAQFLRDLVSESVKPDFLNHISNARKILSHIDSTVDLVNQIQPMGSQFIVKDKRMFEVVRHKQITCFCLETWELQLTKADVNNWSIEQYVFNLEDWLDWVDSLWERMDDTFQKLEVPPKWIVGKKVTMIFPEGT